MLITHTLFVGLGLAPVTPSSSLSVHVVKREIKAVLLQEPDKVRQTDSSLSKSAWGYYKSQTRLAQGYYKSQTRLGQLTAVCRSQHGVTTRARQG